MPRRHLRLFALLIALFAALLTSCGGSPEQQDRPPPLPEGAELLTESAEAMRAVTTIKAAVEVQGDLPGFPVQAAEGQLTREGSAKGTAMVEQGGQLVELNFVILGDTLYLRGPTGGFRELPKSSAFLIYDPTVILDPNQGIPAVLASGTEATTQAREQVLGVDSYRVQTTFPRETLGKLLPGFTQNTTGQVWIATEGSQLVQAQFPTKNGRVTFRFSDFDAPADITAPS